ncbi:MAG: 5-(carboxyamino)imidazole ribonucleotide synthase [Vagococcus sp.]
MIVPGQTIGIIGGQHVSRLLVLSAKKMGYKVGILDPMTNCPAGQVADWQIVADYNDEAGLLKLSKRSHVITYEFENIDVNALEYLEKLVYIPQGTFGLSITQDRLLERQFLDNHMINIVPYETAVLISDIKEATTNIGYPCVLKSIRRYSEDDLIVKIESEGDIDKAVPLIQQGPCIVEAYVSLQKELFVTIGINRNGEYTIFPIVETIHYKDGRLKKVRAPIDIVGLDDLLENQIHLIAKVIASELNVSGVVGIEFFLTEDGNLYVNEISARPHESGTYSMDACNFSEYDVHVRGICNWSMPKVEQFIPAIMFNITSDNYLDVLKNIPKKRNWHYYFYDYPSDTHTLKLGHITVLSDNIEETIQDVINSKLI